MLGPDATFREGQREAIEAVIEDGHRALVVQRTGWGKSLVYWIATRVRRDQRPRPDAHHQPAPRADAQPDRDGRPPRPAGRDDQLGQRRRVGRHRTTGLAADAIDVLLISPERLANERFTTDVLPEHPGLDRPVRRRRGALHLRLGPRLPARLPAHRPDPRRARPARARCWPRRPPPTTASSPTSPSSSGTARPVLRGPLARALARSSMRSRSRTRPSASPGSPSELPKMPGSGIVYCLTVADTQRVATFLRVAGHRCPAVQRRPLDRRSARRSRTPSSPTR